MAKLHLKPSHLLLATLLASGGCNPAEPSRVPQPPAAVIDHPGSGESVAGKLAIDGWALDLQGRIKAIEVLLDGKTTGIATYGVRRDDVCRMRLGRPGCPNVGWRSIIDVSAVQPGEHRLGLRVTGPFGNQFETASRPIMVEARR